MSSTGTQAIDRAAALMTLVVQADEPISFTELVEETGLPRSTTSRLLSAMENHRMLERDGSGYYIAGALFALYAARHDPWDQVVRLAEPTLHKIGIETRETVNLGIARGDTVVQIAQVDATFMLGARDWMQVAAPPHCSALGKVLYAHGCLSLPEGRLPTLTERSLATSAELAAEVAVIRKRGFATTCDELELGLAAVAAPVSGLNGDVVAALGVSGPSTRLSAQLDEVGQLLKQHGSALSGLLRRRMRKEGVT